MKKSLIAGAGVAALAMAALPFAGVFADTTTITDNIQVTVSSSCTMAEDSSSTASTTVTGNSYSGSGAPGDLVTLGTSGTASPTQITIKCNANNGYTLTPTFSALSNGTTAHNITYSGSPEASGGSKTWTAYYTKGGTTTAFSGSAVSGQSTMTDTYEFSYKVGLSNDQATGTYNGTAQYVLAPAA